MLFVAADLIFAMAIPFVAISGYHTLLDSRVGRFTAEPTRSEPGWSALVEPTALTAVVEVHDQQVSGVALLVAHDEPSATDTVILLPGSLEIDGQPLFVRSPIEAVAALSSATRLAISSTVILDDPAWIAALGAKTIRVDNPDPVTDADGVSIFAVGSVSVAGDNASAFLGRPTEGASLVSVTPRRHLLWNAIVNQQLDRSTAIGEAVEKLDPQNSQILDVPMTQLEPVSLPDFAAMESLVRDVMAFPSGSAPGDRLQIRVIDRTGSADLEDIAAVLASRGIEVLEIGNAAAFDRGKTELVVPAGLVAVGSLAGESAEPATGADPVSVINPKAQLDGLAGELGIVGVVDPEDPSGYVATVLIGSDFEASNLY